MIETSNIHGLEGVLAALQSLPAEIVSKRGGVVRVALRKGAVVFVKQAKANVQRIIAEDEARGGDQAVSTGALLKALGTTRDRHPELSGCNERYIVKIRKGPRVHNLTPAQYGRLIEFGDERQTAKPFMTPAYYERRQEALDTVVRELHKGVEKAILKAAALGKV